MIQSYIKVYGIKHTPIANLYDNLASFCWRFSNNIKKAEEYFENSFELKEKNLDKNSVEIRELYFEYENF